MTTKRNTIQNFVPSVRLGAGLPLILQLLAVGSFAASGSADLDSYKTTPDLLPRRDGAAVVLNGVNYTINGVTASQAALYKNGVQIATSLGTAGAALSGTIFVVQVDLRDQYGNGISLLPTDTLTLRLPTSSAPATMVKASISAMSFGASG